MATKLLKLNIFQHVLTLEAPRASCKDDLNLWVDVQRVFLRTMTRNRKISAIAIGPPEEPTDYFSHIGLPCTRYKVRDCECFVLSPDVWTDEMIDNTVDTMSFELGHLWLFQQPVDETFNSVSDLVATINKCRFNNDDYPKSEVELVGNVDDDTALIWINWTNGQDVKDRLINNINTALQSAPVSWTVITKSELESK